MSAGKETGSWLLNSVEHTNPEASNPESSETTTVTTVKKPARKKKTTQQTETQQTETQQTDTILNPVTQEAPDAKAAMKPVEEDQDWTVDDDPWQQFIRSGSIESDTESDAPTTIGDQEEDQAPSDTVIQDTTTEASLAAEQQAQATTSESDHQPIPEAQDPFDMADIEAEGWEFDNADTGWDSDSSDDVWGFTEDSDQSVSVNQPQPDIANEGPDPIWGDEPDHADTLVETPPTPVQASTDDSENQLDLVQEHDPDIEQFTDDDHDYAIPNDDFGQAIAQAPITRHSIPWKRIVIILISTVVALALIAALIYMTSTIITRRHNQTEQAQQTNSLASAQTAFTKEQKHLKTQITQIRQSPVADDPSLKVPLVQADAAANLPTPMTSKDITQGRKTIRTASTNLERAYNPLINASITHNQQRLRSLLTAADRLKDEPDGTEHQSMLTLANQLRGITITRENIQAVSKQLDQLDADVKAVQQKHDETAKAKSDKEAADTSTQQQNQAAPQQQAPSYTPKYQPIPQYTPAPQQQAPAPTPVPTPTPAPPSGSIGIEG